MRRTRSVLLALVAAFIVALLGAGPAAAATTVVRAVDTGGDPRWEPASPTIQVGDTVEWNFDEAQTVHDVESTSANWDIDTDIIAPGGDPVSYTFDEPGTYTFVCTVHPQTMTGSVVVEEPDVLDNVLVVSKTAGFRHDSIDEGIAAIQSLGADNGFEVDVVDGAMTAGSSDAQLAAAFTDENLAQYDVVAFLSTTSDILTAPMQEAFERYIQDGGGYAGIHAASDTEYTWPWYGQLVGGYFRNHPPGTPTATVDIEDGDEPSTEGIPASWTRTDEWYNFQDITEPVVNGSSTVADYSPRASNVHVLATVDEGTYDEQDGNAIDDDHPVAWCSEFDGGRSWYTAMGHTAASFAEPDFLAHLLGGLRTAAGVGADCGAAREPAPTAEDFEKVTLDNDTRAPMEVAIAPDGRVFYIELGQPVPGGQPNQATGELRVWDPDTQQSEIAHTLIVDNSHENGLVGLTLAPDFAITGHLYMAYSVFGPEPIDAKVNRISRFTVSPDNGVGNEVPIYEWTHQRAQCCHTGGSLDFGPDGSLYLSTGDNTNPFAHGFNPTDERPGRSAWDAQRTSANTNDANGKVLRIIPRANPMGSPGIGTTYDIPTGNMFPVGTAQTLPEIYAMGFRNPFRIHVDEKTGWVLLGDYGPDAGSANPNRGPQGSVEYNVVTEPGFYGWPYCVRQNVPYHDITYTSDSGGTSNGTYNCAAPVNDSPNNTGLTNLPPAQPATMWMAYSETDTRFPGLGTGGAPTGGTRYYYDPDTAGESPFPPYYNGHWFIGEWNNDWVKTATLNTDGLATGVECFAICTGYVSPMDLEFGPDGSLYVVEWGQGFAENNPDSGVYRIDYIRGDRLPIARASATPDAGPIPLEVTFSSAGSEDPDGTAITYAWDFDGDGETDSTDPNPTHTYETAGTYQARLTVTDESGATGTDSVTVVAGNSRPVVTIEIPENGKVSDFGDTIPYRISVTDAEDGSTADGGIDCANIQIEFKLGHDSHAHELSSATGCEGEFQLTGVAGHGPDANVFTVITAAYADGGNGPAQSVTGIGEAILQPKLKQAEYWDTTGRTEDSIATSGDPGITNEATTDAGGGNSAAFIEDGDWISFNPYNLEDLSKVTFRVASAGAGGIIQLRYDAPDGPLVAETPLIAPTGGWQTWQDVTIDLPGDVPEGTHRLFVLFRHPTATGSLLNLNWFKFIGKGAANTAPPEVSVAAEPTNGTAPLEVAFAATATDEEGEALTYEWDFGVPGTNDDTSTEEDPTYTYEAPGNYTATVTVTDASGGSASASVDVRATRPVDQCPTDPVHSDEFDGTGLGPAWSVVRQDQSLSVSGGALHIPAAAGDLYGADSNNAANLVLRDAPEGPWTATAKIAFEGTHQWHQAGMLVYGDDDNFTKLGRLATNAGGDGTEKFEFIYENGGQPRNEAADSTGNLPADFPRDYYVRIVSDGTNVTGSYSTDGTTWTPVGRPAPLPADPQIGLFAFSNAAATAPIADFDSFTLETPGGGGPGGPSYDDEFEGSTLDKERWNAIVRDNPAAYSVAGGKLTITTEPGDIYTVDTDPPPNNLILQSADHAGEDWVIETKIDSATINGGYGQGGLLAYADGDNYVKFDAISDAGVTRINRLELRSEVGGAIQPNPADPAIDVGVTEIWLRLTKSGTDYSGEYSLDGENWTALASPVVNAMESPDFGIFAFGPQEAGQGDLVPFEYFTLDGEDPPACDCESSGDEFEGGALDKERWNGILREDESLYSLQDGQLRVTTVGGDIYSDPDTRDQTRNFFLQTADHAGADWVIETKVGGADISGGYEHGGLLAYEDDGNYVKFDLISDDGQTAVNRIELRSEVGGVVQNPQPQFNQLPPGTTDAWLRLTKSGTTYTGEYSFDGETWTALPSTVDNPMVAPRFGLFTQGVNSPGGVITFDYFSVDGETGCPGEEPTNEAPVLGDVTATPTSGFAPLPVQFAATATDADEDELTYSWDFDGDGEADSDEQNPTHTYDEAGTYAARVTVSDGEATASRTVTVTVLPADDAEARFRVLVFSKTTGFRHDSIDEGIAAVQALGEANNFQVDASEDATLFRDGVLSRYDTVVFLSTTGDPLNDAQQAAFERYIQAGGGYTGIHAAADTEYGWTWYGELVGAYFLSHPPGTPTATVHVEDTDHPSTEGIDTPWQRTDEWYNYKSPFFAEVGDADFSPRGNVHVLANVDESTYDEQDGNTTDDDHPISWCQRFDGGRSWYTGMGHTAASFSESDFLVHILGGIEVTAGAVDDPICGDEPQGDGPIVQAFADPSSGTAPLQVNFSATAIDPDGGAIQQYRWEFSDGGSAFGTSVSRTYTQAGTYTATVTVTDNEGDTTSEEVTVTVTGSANAAPEIIEAVADRTSGPAPLDVLFQAVADDPDGDALTYRWEFGDGGAAFGEEAEHVYLEPGEYEAVLTVTDTAGNADTATIAITVSNPPGNRAPTVEAAAVPQSGSAPLAVQFSAQGSDPDGDALTYRWDFGDGTAAVAGRRARHTYTSNGVYTARVTATDRAGNTATDEVTITVGNPNGGQAPTVQAAADRLSGAAPLRVNFSAAANDPDGDPVTYVWDFGDGTAAGGTRVSHTYATAGTYTVTVTVTDPSGKTGSASVTITVTAPPQVAAGGPPPEAPAAAAGLALERVSTPAVGRFVRRGLKVSATCAADGKAAAGLWASKRTARKLGLRSRGLGRRTLTCSAGERVTVRLKPTRKVRRAIRATKAKRLRVTVALALQGGSAVQRTITIAR